jgi:MerR family copper efflux transcriptional regulator
MTPSLTIGQVAHDAGVAVDTVRFYERQGLIPEPPRKRSGYRQYPAETVPRIRFIRRAKDLGFTLEEVAELLALRATSGRSCADVRAHASATIGRIEEKLRALEKMKSALSRLVATCTGRGSTRECPILESLEQLDQEEE